MVTMRSLPRYTQFLSLTILSLALAACSKADGTADTLKADTASVMAPAPTPPVSAEAAEDRVEAALDAHTELQAFGLDADDKDGRLILKGAVRTAEQKALAETTAAALAAGVPIDNRIRIDGKISATATKPVDADDAEDAIEDAFDADSAIDALDLDVDESNGSVVLEGNVKTAAQKAAAETLAKATAPTITIVNKIAVKP